MNPSILIKILILFLVPPAWGAPTEGLPEATSVVASDTKKEALALESEAPVEVLAAVEPQKTDIVPSSPSLLGFKSWKQQQVFKARATLDVTRRLSWTASGGKPTQAVENSGENPDSRSASVETEERLRQLEFNLEIAQGLTIHDYFSLYLKGKTEQDMALIIPKLSPEELSALLSAYRKSLDGVPPTENTSPGIPSKKL